MEIKPCPFCGSSQVYLSSYLTEEGLNKSQDELDYYIQCFNCLAEGPIFNTEQFINAEEKAIESWNIVSEAVLKAKDNSNGSS